MSQGNNVVFIKIKVYNFTACSCLLQDNNAFSFVSSCHFAGYLLPTVLNFINVPIQRGPCRDGPINIQRARSLSWRVHLSVCVLVPTFNVLFVVAGPFVCLCYGTNIWRALSWRVLLSVCVLVPTFNVLFVVTDPFVCLCFGTNIQRLCFGTNI